MFTKSVILPVSLLLCGMTSSVLAAVDPSLLVRVNDQTKQKCVEYYSYQDAMFCSTKAMTKDPVDLEIKNFEKMHIIFDERPWMVAWGKKRNGEVMVEYVPMGDDINNWHELVTSQYYPGLQALATPKEFADKFIEGLHEAGFEPIVKFFKDSPDQVIFEYRLEKPESQIQDEIQVINKGSDGLYALFYVIKEADMGQKRRDKWLSNLSSSRIR